MLICRQYQPHGVNIGCKSTDPAKNAHPSLGFDGHVKAFPMPSIADQVSFQLF
jgi:hypothetical protein